jgi:hypothetical protein
VHAHVGAVFDQAQVSDDDIRAFQTFEAQEGVGDSLLFHLQTVGAGNGDAVGLVAAADPLFGGLNAQQLTALPSGSNFSKF